MMLEIVKGDLVIWLMPPPLSISGYCRCADDPSGRGCQRRRGSRRIGRASRRRRRTRRGTGTRDDGGGDPDPAPISAPPLPYRGRR